MLTILYVLMVATTYETVIRDGRSKMTTPQAFSLIDQSPAFLKIGKQASVG